MTNPNRNAHNNKILDILSKNWLSILLLKPAINKNEITTKTTLKKIIEKKGADEILAKNGVPCLSCPMAAKEIDKLEIGKVCKMYKLNLAKILKELNADK